MVVDLEAHKVLPPSKVSSKTSGQRYCIMTVSMALDSEKLTVQFGKGLKHKLVVREKLGIKKRVPKTRC